jgi:hypothetical protein
MSDNPSLGLAVTIQIRCPSFTFETTTSLKLSALRSTMLFPHALGAARAERPLPRLHHEATHRGSHDACNDEHQSVRADSRMRLERRDEPDRDNPDGDES